MNEKEKWKETEILNQQLSQQMKTRHRMNHLRLKYNLFIDIKYKENDVIKQEDKFCPLIEQICLGEMCAFWIDDTLACKYGAGSILIRKKSRKKEEKTF